MVKVKIAYRKSLIESMIVKGHANAGSFGNDLVCAGCSSIVFGLANACDEMCRDKVQISMNKNDAQFRVIESDDISQAILNTGMIQLKTIAESYPENVSIEITEG